MMVILADYDPGTLTGFYTLVLLVPILIVCLICAASSALLKKWQAFRRWMTAVFVVFSIAILLAWLEHAFAEQLHLL